MGKPYLEDIAKLPETAEAAASADISRLTKAVRDVSDRNLSCVSSGGGVAAAEFAAHLHEATTGHMARAITPLELMRRPKLSGEAHTLISGGGSNPDILAAAGFLLGQADANESERFVISLCASADSPLTRLVRERGNPDLAIEESGAGHRDGFLATHSLIQNMILLARAYSATFEYAGLTLSQDLADIANEPLWFGKVALDRALFSDMTIIALSSGLGRPALTDLESRCHESGLANIMTCDYRNFAHGRHQFLVERAGNERTVIVSLEHPAVRQDAADLLMLLPPEHTPVIRLSTDRTDVSAAIELVISSMILTREIAWHLGADPGQPEVSDFGRRMYASKSLMNQASRI